MSCNPIVCFKIRARKFHFCCNSLILQPPPNFKTQFSQKEEVGGYDAIVLNQRYLCRKLMSLSIINSKSPKRAPRDNTSLSEGFIYTDTSWGSIAPFGPCCGKDTPFERFVSVQNWTELWTDYICKWENVIMWLESFILNVMNAAIGIQFAVMTAPTLNTVTTTNTVIKSKLKVSVA